MRSNPDYRGALKLSDPDARQDVEALRRQITRTKASATKFLQDCGILTKTGRLARRFGGK